MLYDWKYLVEVDFAGDKTVVKDAYMQYQGWKIGDTPLIFRVGNFKTPNTFEDLTSDQLRRHHGARKFHQCVGYRPETIGSQIAYWTPHWGLAAGIFGERAQSNSAL